MLDPKDDGVKFINIYSKAGTALGKMLSNFSLHKVDTVDGMFPSIESYWYFLATGGQHSEFRNIAGFKAKERGQTLLAGFSEYPTDPEFQLKIMGSMLSKLILNPELLKEFKKNKLPFEHFYVYSGKVVQPKGGRWVTETWNHIQKMLMEYPNG